ncbi:MAG: SH3 domain-containing protein [Oligoflexia bacterium]|nr:SH3 domain-containing protein [Oligoflexia bacterium]
MHLKKLALFILLILPEVTIADDPSQIFNQAVREFQSGNLTRSVELFKSAADQPRTRAQSYYNLGIIALRQKQFGLAAAYLRKGLNFQPRDPQGRMALRSALEQIPEAARYAESNWGIFRKLVLSQGTLREFLIVLFFAMTWFLFNLYKFLQSHKDNPGAWPSLLIVWGILFVLSLGLATSKLVDQTTRRVTIVAPSSALKSGPDSTTADIARVTEGLEFAVIETQPGWFQVRSKDGSIGWVSENQAILTTGF